MTDGDGQRRPRDGAGEERGRKGMDKGGALGRRGGVGWATKQPSNGGYRGVNSFLEGVILGLCAAYDSAPMSTTWAGSGGQQVYDTVRARMRTYTNGHLLHTQPASSAAMNALIRVQLPSSTYRATSVFSPPMILTLHIRSAPALRRMRAIWPHDAHSQSMKIPFAAGRGKSSSTSTL